MEGGILAELLAELGIDPRKSILIGVPIALGLAHYGLSIQERARQADDRARLQRGLKSLAVAVRHNADRLRDLSESLRDD